MEKFSLKTKAGDLRVEISPDLATANSVTLFQSFLRTQGVAIDTSGPGKFRIAFLLRKDYVQTENKEIDDRWSLETVVLFADKKLFQSQGQEFTNQAEQLGGPRDKNIKFLLLLEEVEMLVEAEHNRREFQMDGLGLNLAVSSNSQTHGRAPLPFDSAPKLEEWLISRLINLT